MQIVFRCDASNIIGTGHVIRCLTLASKLRSSGSKCIFMARKVPGNLNTLIKNNGFEVYELPSLENISDSTENNNLSEWLGTDWITDANDCLKVLKNKLYDWLIVDHYGIDNDWEKKVGQKFKHVLVIDDLANRPHVCDLLLDQNWFGIVGKGRYEKYIPNRCEKLLGPEYALLKPEYLTFRNTISEKDGSVKNVLVFMGGSDPTNETLKVLSALNSSEFKELSLDVVIGENHPDPGSIKKALTTTKNSRLHRGLPSLAELMKQADLMISAGGTTTWERMCLGLPAIVISIADNQMLTNSELMKAGYIFYLGDKANVMSNDIKKSVHYCMNHPGELCHQSKIIKLLVTGCGSEKVSKKIYSYGS
jgi:UDP-2,4-diacetamido-2,4,6-trideoxy-beta-L-altropyranose hydrolase